MKKVIIKEREIETNKWCDVSEDSVVLAKNSRGRIVGMIIEEHDGYITRKRDGSGSSGHHPTLYDCIKRDSEFYTYFIE